MWDFIIKKITPYVDSAPAWVFLIVFTIVGVALALKWIFDALDKATSISDRIKKNSFLFFKSEGEQSNLLQRKRFLQILRLDIENISRKESWNDQAFADLDADVETEGWFYRGFVNEVFKRSSNGIAVRRSLISAIKSSANAHCLILGEPGSGKSVAVRHLALILAKKAESSACANALTPLYVNLREWSSERYGPPDAITIKNFIIDNLRHDSPATSEYLSKYWDSGCSDGTWFFILDSFDEIPEVLHATDGGDAKAKYVAAIIAFLRSVGTCKAVIASREFKCPEVGGWNKVKILALSEARQNELISKALIRKESRLKVARYLADSEKVLYGSPMFLTLLCAYVEKHGAVPPTDFDLLDRHIKELLVRDESYLNRVFRLNSKDLYNHATALSAIYAQKTSHGLSPTYEGLKEVVTPETSLGRRLHEVLSALAACKILRRDSVSISGESERFVFAHRRYQETLFVKCVVSDESTAWRKKFVTEREWREYLVTLLQGQAPEIVSNYLPEIGIRLRLALKNIKKTLVFPKNTTGPSYFEWKGSDIAYYLGVMLEGLRGRFELIPIDMREMIESFLRERLDQADPADRYMIVRYAVMAGNDFAKKVLSDAVCSASIFLKYEAFKKVNSLTVDDPAFSQFVRRTFSNQVIAAIDRNDKLRCEVLLEQMGKHVDCKAVYRRALWLRLFFGWAMRFCVFVRRFLGQRHFFSKWIEFMISEGLHTVIPFICAASLSTSAVMMLLLSKKQGSMFKPTPLAYGALFLCVLMVTVSYLLRDEAGPISITRVSTRFKEWISQSRKSGGLLAMGLAAILIAPFVGISWIISDGIGLQLPFWMHIFTGTSLCSILLFTLLKVYILHDSRTADTDIQSFVKRGERGLRLLLRVDSPSRLIDWTYKSIKLGLVLESDMRCLFACIAYNKTSPSGFEIGMKKTMNIQFNQTIQEQLLDVFFMNLNQLQPHEKIKEQNTQAKPHQITESDAMSPTQAEGASS